MLMNSSQNGTAIGPFSTPYYLPLNKNVTICSNEKIKNKGKKGIKVEKKKKVESIEKKRRGRKPKQVLSGNGKRKPQNSFIENESSSSNNTEVSDDEMSDLDDTKNDSENSGNLPRSKREKVQFDEIKDSRVKFKYPASITLNLHLGGDRNSNV